MNNVETLVREIQNSVFGDPWHGAPVKKILEDITEKLAYSRPLINAHNIVELTLHMWAWTEEVTGRLKGNPPTDPPMGDWPNAEDYKHEGWSEIQNKLYVSTKNLINILKNFPEENFSLVVGGLRNPPLGTGITYEAMVHGLAQHNAYHSGQIALLKKYFNRQQFN